MEMTKYLKLIVAVMATGMVRFTTQATPVTAEQAARAAKNWICGGRSLDRRLGREVESAEAVTAANGAAFHVVKVKDGGFVVMSADTTIDPVIAFSSSGELRNDPRNPLWTLLTGDLAARAKARSAKLLSAATSSSAKSVVLTGPEARWAELLGESGAGQGRILLSASTGETTLSDVRVDALVKSAWSQEDYRNFGATGESNYCYNYYTPGHWPCGCVATAGAQIMRYHCHPSAEVTPASYSCVTGALTKVVGDTEYYEGVPVMLMMQGGFYDWNSMPLVPANGCTAASRQAIGKLTSDIGISCGMAYYPDGGSSPVYMLTKSFVDRFQYANAVGVTFASGFYSKDFSYTLERFKSAVIPNFDAGLPVALGISGGGYGHAVVGDGYGYSDGNFYVHINMGWADLYGGNAWYLPPDIDDYDTIDTIVYNVYPQGAVGASLVSGRVLSPSGTAVAGATVTATAVGGAAVSTTSDARGFYALKVSAGTYGIVANKDDMQAELTSVAVGACVSTAYSDSGAYFSSPVPKIGNVYGQDLTLDEVSQDEPAEGTVSVTFIAAGGAFPGGTSTRRQALTVGRYYMSDDGDFPVRPVRAGYVFNGWWDKSAEPPSYVGGSGEGTFGGLYVDEELSSNLTAGWDDPYVICERTADLAKNAEIDPLRISVAGFSTPKITAKGLPSGLSLAGDTIVGTPKNSGVYAVTFTATSPERKGFSAQGSTVFVVREDKSSEHAAYASSDGAAGKVTGGEICAAGQSVTLKAAANKGYVFDRWGWSDETGEAVVSGHDREPSLKFTMPAAGDVRLEAEFVTVQEVSDSVCAWTDNGDFGGEEGGDSVTLLQGVYREWHLAADAMHPVGSIKVSGLPSGLKFTAKAIVDKKTGVTNVPPNTIYGYPSAVSKKAKNATAYTPSAVTVSVTTDSKVTREITWRMTVLPLPEWAAGTFLGHLHHEAEGEMTERSVASLTVGKTGKVSGKFNTYDPVAKKVLKWTFSADGFVESDFDGTDGDSVKSVRIRAAGKSGKRSGDVKLVIDRMFDEREPLLATACATGDASDPTAKDSLGELELWRNIWKDKGAAMTEFAKTYSLLQGTYNIVLGFEDEGCNLQSGYLTLKVDAKGGAKAAGKLPDGSSTSFSPMLSYQDGKFAAKAVVEPSAYKGGFASVVLQFDDKQIDGWGDWLNRSPTTCDVYGMPEGGDFTVHGSLYDKTVKLSSWFNELFVFSDIPGLEYTYKEKTSAGTEIFPDELAEPRNVVQTALAVDAKDKLQAVASAGKPVAVDKANGIWNYDAPNVESVTVSFTPSTGVFKGSHVGWYDYVSSFDKVKGTTTWSHTSKKYSFEGIWVQDPSGETAGELTGFIMFDRTGWQTDAKTGKQKSYKYKVNRSMGLGPVP